MKTTRPKNRPRKGSKAYTEDVYGNVRQYPYTTRSEARLLTLYHERGDEWFDRNHPGEYQWARAYLKKWRIKPTS